MQRRGNAPGTLLQKTAPQRPFSRKERSSGARVAVRTRSVSRTGSLAALERLREGNRRFIANVRGIDAMLSQHRRAELAANPQPFAIVLGCSDSRAPAEILFD